MLTLFSFGESRFGGVHFRGSGGYVDPSPLFQWPAFTPYPFGIDVDRD